MGKKYIILDETRGDYGTKLHRIQALMDFECQGKKVKAGDLGGLVEHEGNLSQYGTCWIFFAAYASGNARVIDDAIVQNFARVSGDALVSENASVSDRAVISGRAVIKGNAKIFEEAAVRDNVLVCDQAQVHGRAQVICDAKISGKSDISGTRTAIASDLKDQIVAFY